MSRRDQIVLSDAELAAFLDEQRTVIVATNGSDGWPHLMPLWYVVRDGTIWSWTYGKSQKIRNIERDPHVTLQIEDGERYEELRGVMIKATAKLHTNLDVVSDLGTEIFTRYTATAAGEGFEEIVAIQAPKRTAIEFTAETTVSWDHRKLGGTY